MGISHRTEYSQSEFVYLNNSFPINNIRLKNKLFSKEEIYTSKHSDNLNLIRRLNCMDSTNALTTQHKKKQIINSANFSYNQQGKDWDTSSHGITQQSPIDITTKDTTSASELEFSFKFHDKEVTGVKLNNEGVTLKANVDVSTLVAKLLSSNKVSFQTLQFHFHAPSEHKIDGV